MFRALSGPIFNKSGRAMLNRRSPFPLAHSPRTTVTASLPTVGLSRLGINETQAPSIMYPAGYRKNSFKLGDEVTVSVEPVKNGLPIGRIREVVLANGTTLGGIAGVPAPKGQ